MLSNGHETKPVKCLAFVHNGLQQMPNASKQKQKTVRLPGFPLFFQSSIQGSSSSLGFVYPLDPQCHQKFQVPKMQVLNLVRLFWRCVFPYISRILTAYIGFCTCILDTFPKCLVTRFRRQILWTSDLRARISKSSVPSNSSG